MVLKSILYNAVKVTNVHQIGDEHYYSSVSSSLGEM